jgi:LmbE family N-acetylglucosaminyl deacetylase
VLVFISTGDIDGKGKIRQKEILESAQVLGSSFTAVKVVSNAKLRDGICWDTHDILKKLTDVIKEIPGPSLEIITTFDEGGATGHRNPKSLLFAAVLLSFAKVYASRTRRNISLLAAGEAIARALMIGGQQDVKGVKEVLFVRTDITVRRHSFSVIDGA